ncbi:MAG: LLM class flavin-dependent oxidoreductase [Deltaproteobacteria bacterium]|jgi:alkanesulfonate monooxygenase SsuD/methylene tetrahydromethanopterin reductase-like flavin-dependent oxidoreductase (luciferase family)|nr:LLM class flavin-dependent oxidoreductase [Deltaproteobacteria bacterium]
MKVGVLQFFGWRDRSMPLEDVYERALARIEIMDRTGYDAVWLAEHHFTGYSVCPSVHVMAAHVAARTRNLRIGTGVTLASFYHPLQIAEEVALLDHLTGGRINWGAGRGFDPREFSIFDIPVEESADRFREAVEIVLAAWTNEKLDFEGRFHRYQDVEVLPKPKQRPHPPTWVAAASLGAIDWAASKGLSILMDPHSPHREIRNKLEHYAKELERAGHALAGREIPMGRLVAVAKTDTEAEEIARRGAQWTSGAYIPKEDLAQFRGRGESAEEIDPVAHYLDDVMIYGCPERVVDRLNQLEEEIPLAYLLLSPMSEKTFGLFTEQVLPHVSG